MQCWGVTNKGQDDIFRTKIRNKNLLKFVLYLKHKLYSKLKVDSQMLDKGPFSWLDPMCSMLMHSVRLSGSGMFVAQLTYNTIMLNMLGLNVVYHVWSLLAYMLTLSTLKTRLNLVKHSLDCFVKFFK